MNATRQTLAQRRAFAVSSLLRLPGGCFSVCAVFLFSIVPAAAALAAANENICCNDANGRYTCGDVMPPRCNGRLLKIYNQQGFLIRTVSPRMSEEEKKLAAEEAGRQQEEQARVREQARKDRALLQTYDSVTDLDRVQERSEADVKIAIRNAQSLVDAAQKRKKALEGEVAASALSPEIASQIRNEETTIKAQRALLEAKKNELAQIRAKFAEDRNRYILLTTPDSAGGSGGIVTR
ncbi:MAG: hypothetical protein LBD68_06785 [Zoogloeaceae bacterium]|jgi:hypothetical protein|nr:hypothetical protein [Zoogloeaceae bacterium]